MFGTAQKNSEVYLVSPYAPGYEDNILMKADKNPNSKGAEMLGYRQDLKALHGLFEMCRQGKVEGLVVFGQDLLTLHGEHLSKEALNRISWSVFIGSNHNLMSEYAAYVLPSATHFEKQGTFTNFEGRTQKFEKVLEPLGEAKPEWQILTALAGQIGMHMHFDEAEEIFSEMALAFPAFKGMTYEALGTGGLDIRKFAAPMIPAHTQDSKLIFYTTK
ncbi:MAG: hypothetical protein A2Z83_02740 [Omnitrophica bacterium GWA2_52_8]|nr:MAG: hypothetical protein A2Z83_02740 [Omnitrophica bacterium GWA2_52_8]